MLKLTLLLCVLALIAQPALFQECIKLKQPCSVFILRDDPDCCRGLICDYGTNVCEQLPEGEYE
nr:venom polypeptide precursor [Doratifera vulnerans]